MNPIIPQQEGNSQGQEGNPDETAAVLSFATKLSENAMPKAHQDEEMGAIGEEEQEIGQDGENGGKPNQGANKGIEARLKDFKKEVSEMMEEKIESIKEVIQEALKEDGKE